MLFRSRLESTAYFQKSRSLDDYIDEFQDLITEAGYTDPKTIVVKFRRGLNAQIQNVVATMASGRPSNTSPDEWYSMAQIVDQNRVVCITGNPRVTPALPLPLPSSPMTLVTGDGLPWGRSKGQSVIISS